MNTEDFIRVSTCSSDIVCLHARENAVWLKDRYLRATVRPVLKTTGVALLLAAVWMLITFIDIVRYDADTHEDLQDTLDEIIDHKECGDLDVCQVNMEGADNDADCSEKGSP